MTTPERYPKVEAVRQIMKVYEDRWGVDQQDGYDEFEQETYEDILKIVTKLVNDAVTTTHAVHQIAQESTYTGLFQQQRPQSYVSVPITDGRTPYGDKVYEPFFEGLDYQKDED